MSSSGGGVVVKAIKTGSVSGPPTFTKDQTNDIISCLTSAGKTDYAATLQAILDQSD